MLSLIRASSLRRVVRPAFGAVRFFSSSDSESDWSDSDESGSGSEEGEGARMTDNSSPSIRFNFEDCIQCGGCIAACEESANVLHFGETEDGDEIPATISGALLNDTECISCGQCATACPVGCITEVDSVQKVMEMLDSGKTVVLQTAPAPRVAIAEEFGRPAGEISTGKMVSAAKQAGFNYVFDTNFAADLTIMEEAHEFIDRVTNGGVLPMFTSCCPGWVNLVEKRHTELMPNLSSCRSPMMMEGSVIKSYWAEKNGVNLEDIYTVALMPCTAKKDEITREQMFNEVGPSVDNVLTTREFAKVLKNRGIDWESLSDEGAFDNSLGESSGAGVIFASSGGVMEAALRSAYEVISGEELPDINIEAARGIEGVKQFTVPIKDMEVKCAVISGASNADEFMQKVIAKEDGYDQFHFVEVMACPGGCINGGGQPRGAGEAGVKARLESIYSIDADSPVRKSHQNVEVQELYNAFLEKPNSHKAHELLHTSYKNRKVEA